MSKFTLRKAAHVRKRIEAEIERLRPKPKKNRYGLDDDKAPKHLATAAISVFADPEKAVTDAAARFEADLGLVRNLERVLGAVRAAVAHANGTSGVAALMAKATAYRAESKRIDETLEGVGACDLAQLKTAVELNRKRFDGAAGTVQETVASGVLSAERIAALKEESARLRREANVCDDEVAALNLKTKIEIADADIAYLEKAGVI